MYWYALVGFLALVVLIIENHSIMFYNREDEDFAEIGLYRRFLFGIAAYYITDILWGILDSMHLTALLYLDTVVYFVAMAVCVLFWTQYVVAYLGENNAFSRFLSLAGRVMFSVVAAAAVVNCFTPVLFWFDKSGTYHACPARHGQLIAQIIILFLTSAYAHRAMRKSQRALKKRYRTILLFGLVVATLLIVQLKYPFLPLYTIGFMLGSCLLHTFVVSNEIDEYRQTIVEKQKQSELASAASNAKSTFLSNMSHEIRTPINVVLGMNEMILRESAEPNVLEYSENIRIAGNSLLGIVNDILDFSKIETGKLEILPVDYDLSSVLNDMVNMVQRRADEKGLALKLDFDPDTPRLLHGDELRVKQIITNLLTNAVKYTEKGSISFNVGFKRVPDIEESIFLTVSVVDTGIGIKKDDMDKLFSEFERIEEKRNRNIEGTGLGMNITESLLEMMGSHLEINSEYGKGSDFSFSLKQEVVAWDKLGNYEESYHAYVAKQKTYQAMFSAPNAIVLVVDDNPMNLTVFRNLLKRTKVQIDTAESGAECLTLSRDKKYDLIFLDHMMPEMDGIETLQALKAEPDNPNHNTLTVSLTANAISGARDQYIEAGFTDYLSKPIDSEKLEKMLLSYLPDDKIEESVEVDTDIAEEDQVEIPEKLQSLSKSEVLDLETGIANNGSVRNFLPVLQLFYRSIRENADNLEKMFAEEDIANYTIKIHALKSSAKIIGASALSEAAQNLETAGKSGDLSYIRENHSAFISQYLAFREPLSEVFPSEEDEENKPEAGADILQHAYEVMRYAADDMDCDRLQDIFKDMDSYRIPEAETSKWEKLRKASDNYDYDAVLNILEEEG